MNTFSPAELEQRRTFIGGSEAAAAIGLNKYQAAFDLWQVKLGLAPDFEGNEFTLWGKLHEPVIRQQYAERMNQVVRLPAETIRHEKYPFMACHPDGITDSRRLFEAKTAGRSEGWGETGSDQIPEDYMIQVQHNMLVLDLEVCDLAALINGNDLRIYEIRAHRQLQDSIIDLEARFWHHVETKTCPPPDFSRKDCVEVLQRMYPGTNGETLFADAIVVEIRDKIEDYAQAEKAAKAAKDGYKAQLLARMGEATFMQFKDGKQFRRQLISKKGHVVAASEYMDLRLTNV